MTNYTIYPFKASGVALMFLNIDEADDAAAAAMAMTLLEDHPSADRVTVWRQDTIVFSGPSSGCADWLAAGVEGRANCPAVNRADQSCPPDCGRFASGRQAAAPTPAQLRR